MRGGQLNARLAENETPNEQYAAVCSVRLGGYAIEAPATADTGADVIGGRRDRRPT